jgi:hypothetical protein
MSRHSLLLAAVLAATAACSADPRLSRSEQSIVDGSPSGVGLLAFVNDAATTFELLDSELDRRAASNLIDERPFSTVDEVDAVKYVGPAALDDLLSMASALGYVPTGSDVLGSYDGVSFTVDEAELTLATVNQESASFLKSEVGLPSRAVTSIVDARPVDAMPVLADLYWVGPAGLTHLRDHADELLDSEDGDRPDCLSNADCEPGWVCGGFVADGSTPYGKCHESDTPAGYWTGCSASNPCPGELFCSGLTMWNAGFCSPQWMQETFHQDTPKPLAAGASVTSSVIVYGQASVPMDIVVELELEHSHPEELRITLFDPNGADAVIWNGPSEGGAPMPNSLVALGNISRDDMVNGRWTLMVDDLGGSGSGVVHGWQLWLSSRFD